MQEGHNNTESVEVTADTLNAECLVITLLPYSTPNANTKSRFGDTVEPCQFTLALLPPSPTTTPIPEEEESYSSWSLFLVCLLVLSLWKSYHLQIQIKRIRTIRETVVSIIADMVAGFTVRLVLGHLIGEMLVSHT